MRRIIKTRQNNNMISMMISRQRIINLYLLSITSHLSFYLKYTVGFEYLSLISGIGVAHCLSSCTY